MHAGCLLAVLFNDTIFYNIVYGRLSATREEVEEAARRVGGCPRWLCCAVPSPVHRLPDTRVCSCRPRSTIRSCSSLRVTTQSWASGA